MTVHTLFPSYIVIDYHSDVARHKMTIPTRQWNALGGTGVSGGYAAWDATDRDASEMVNDLVDVLVGRSPDAVTFDQFIVYNFPSIDDDPVPVAGEAFTAKVGLDGSPGWYKAVQATFSFFDTGFLPCKLVLLDAAANNGFDRRTPANYVTEETAIADEFVLASNAWASRAGNRPSVFRTVTYTINVALRKQYGFT